MKIKIGKSPIWKKPDFNLLANKTKQHRFGAYAKFTWPTPLVSKCLVSTRNNELTRSHDRQPCLPVAGLPMSTWILWTTSLFQKGHVCDLLQHHPWSTRSRGWEMIWRHRAWFSTWFRNHQSHWSSLKGSSFQVLPRKDLIWKVSSWFWCLSNTFLIY